jgi:phage replication initiation protein
MLDHEPVGVVGLAGLDQAAFDALLVAASLPPVGNTGVERTRPVAPAAAALVDTVTVVFKSLPLETVLRFFATGRDGELEWLATERGRYGYRSGFARQNVHVWHDGTADMGVCVEITGQGCRQLEAEGVVDNSDLLFPGWVGFLGQCRDMGGKFSRLDVAADDYDGLLNLPRMKELAGRDALVTRFKGGLYCENLDFCTGGSSRPTGGATLYAGSQRSEMYVRCYNKAAEQGEKFQGEHWTRLELQTRKDKADLLAGLLIERGTEAFAGVINNLLSFREPSETDTNHRRWPVCEWWCTFVATLERLPLSVAPEQKTLVGAADWVERQIAPYLSMLLEAPDLGVNWLRGVHARALGRWSRRHREMFGAHIAECERIGRLEPPAPLPVPWGYDVRVSFANL